jgi:hypothetical protein
MRYPNNPSEGICQSCGIRNNIIGDFKNFDRKTEKVLGASTLDGLEGKRVGTARTSTKTSSQDEKGALGFLEHHKSTEAFNTFMFDRYNDILRKWDKSGFVCYKTHEPKHSENEKYTCASLSAFKLAGWRASH